MLHFNEMMMSALY